MQRFLSGATSSDIRSSARHVTNTSFLLYSPVENSSKPCLLRRLGPPSSLPRATGPLTTYFNIGSEGSLRPSAPLWPEQGWSLPRSRPLRSQPPTHSISPVLSSTTPDDNPSIYPVCRAAPTTSRLNPSIHTRLCCGEHGKPIAPDCLPYTPVLTTSTSDLHVNLHYAPHPSIQGGASSNE